MTQGKLFTLLMNEGCSNGKKKKKEAARKPGKNVADKHRCVRCTYSKGPYRGVGVSVRKLNSLVSTQSWGLSS